MILLARPLAAAALVLLGATPASATAVGGEAWTGTPTAESEAVRLLAQAASVARERAFSGTQQVDTWRAGSFASAVHDVRYDPVTGLQVQPPAGTDDVAPPAPTVDARLLPVLSRRFDLAVVGPGRCAGRTTRVVEARRADGSVAGRVWLDRDSGLALRREVFDAAGRPVLRTAFTDVTVDGRGVPPLALPRVAAQPVGDQVSATSWPSPDELPGGFGRVSAAPPAHVGPAVQHLAWSDGLSTVSVFSQPGSLDAPGDRGFTPQTVDGSTVWVSHDGPERIVWNGAGQVFTLVSDAGHDDLLAVVRVLPHDPDPDPGLGARLARGLARIGSWLDPTD